MVNKQNTVHKWNGVQEIIGLPVINANCPENVHRFKSSIVSAEPIILNLKSTRSFSNKEVIRFLAFYKLIPMSSGTLGLPD